MATTHPGPSRELLHSTTYLLKRLGFAVKERSYEAFDAIGAGPQQHAVLSLLEEGARETQGTIADALGYDRSQLVGLLDELEERGFVERRRDPDDRRRHLVNLTPDGKRALAEMRTASKRVEKEFLEPLDADERRQLQGLLSKLACHLDTRYAPPRPKP